MNTKEVKWINFLIFVLILVVSTSCSTDAGRETIDNPRGTFDQNLTFELRVHDGLLYAGTEGGLFRKPVDPAATEWESLGLGNIAIQTFLIFTQKKIIISPTLTDEYLRSIAITQDGGSTWYSYQNGFGEEIEVTPLTFDVHPDNPNTLFARARFNVAKSKNGGQSWESIYLTWDHFGTALFVKLDKKNPDIIWAGGSFPTLNAHLIKSADGGKNWKVLPPTDTEANVNDLVINLSQSNTVVAGLSGGFSAARLIRKSTDGGETWTTVFEGINTLTLARSPSNPETIYASGQNAAGTLFFAQSNDFGDTWQLVDVPGAPAGIRVNDMVSVMVGDSEVLYFATNKGVYSYTFEE